MTYSTWISIDSQDDLDRLNESFFWGVDGVETVEFFGCLKNEPYFPTDISRGGTAYFNIHLLVQFNERENEDELDFVEFVLIGGNAESSFLLHPHFKGSVDSLKRVQIDHIDGEGGMSCARLIYRFFHGGVRCWDESYFLTADSV